MMLLCDSKILERDRISKPLQVFRSSRIEEKKLMPSLSISKEGISSERYFIGGKVADPLSFPEVQSLVSSLSGPSKKIERTSSSFNEIYLGCQLSLDVLTYRVYYGNTDESSGSGSGIGVEWVPGKSNHKIKRYEVETFKSYEDLLSLSAGQTGENLSAVVSPMFNECIVDGTLTAIKCKSGSRLSYDVEIHQENQRLQGFRQQIIDLSSYFGFRYRDIYGLFLGENRKFSLHRVQWGIKKKGSEFVNMYFV